MEEIFIVEKSSNLVGEVTISGAKNSILPILCATILTDDLCVIENVASYSDVKTLIEILKILGKNIEYNEKEETVKISGRVSTNYNLPEKMISKLRASFLICGALLSKNYYAKIPMPGGCQIGQRPIDLHLKGFNFLNINTKIENGLCLCQTTNIIGNTIYLDFPSVGATENIILASVLCTGKTIIENPAFEPEITDLCNFLNKMGANIEILTDTINIKGVDSLHSAHHKVIPDRIEAGTFMVASAITKGDITINNVIPEHLKPITSKLREMNVNVIENNDKIRIFVDKEVLKTDIKTMPYPGFPTDLQSQFLTLLTNVKGTSIINESIFENRFMLASELNKMGADIKVENKVSVITGVNSLTGAKVKATDLRGGVSLILAGLIATDKTEISDIYHIERGYHNIEKKLSNLGAKIKKQTSND